MTARISRLPDLATFTAAALEHVRQAAQKAVAQRGRFLMALSGGTTPLPLYAAMAQQGIGVPFDATFFFFGDERFVSMGDPRSTFGAVAPVLFTRAPIPVGNIHPMPVDLTPPGLAASVYEEDMRETFGTPPGETPRFDLLLLGLGADGHTASLFPDSPALEETARLVVAVAAPTTTEPRVPRLTVTLPVVNAARQVLFLVGAPGKESILARVLGGPPDKHLPASLVRPQGGAEWLIREG